MMADSPTHSVFSQTRCSGLPGSVRASALSLSLLCALASPAALATELAIGAPTAAKFLPGCPDAQPGVAGVCVLVSIKPAAQGSFSVHDARSGRFVDDVYANSVRPLNPGKYILHSAGTEGVPGFGVAFTVKAGQVRTLKTATLVIRKPLELDLQTGHDTQGYVPTGTQCVDNAIEYLIAGAWAMVPGTYILDAAGNHQLDIPDCSVGEVPVTLTAGKVVKVQPGGSL